MKGMWKAVAGGFLLGLGIAMINHPFIATITIIAGVHLTVMSYMK